MNNNNAHRGYDPQIEDQNEKQFQMMNEVSPNTGQDIIDQWSRETREQIKNREDFDAWVFGMIKLHRIQQDAK